MAATKSTLTVNGVLHNFKSYIGEVRSNLPWLKKNPHLLDCAAGVSFITGLKPALISCGDLMQLMKDNGTWVYNDHKHLPKRGDVVIFHWNADRPQDHDHIGLVIHADHNSLEYISADHGANRMVEIATTNYNVVTGWGRVVEYTVEKKAAVK